MALEKVPVPSMILLAKPTVRVNAIFLPLFCRGGEVEATEKSW